MIDAVFICVYNKYHTQIVTGMHMPIFFAPIMNIVYVADSNIGQSSRISTCQPHLITQPSFVNHDDSTTPATTKRTIPKVYHYPMQPEYNIQDMFTHELLHVIDCDDVKPLPRYKHLCSYYQSYNWQANKTWGVVRKTTDASKSSIFSPFCDDTLDVICSFLGVPQSIHTIGLLNYGHYDFVKTKSVTMWDRYPLVMGLRTDLNICRLRFWLLYATRIRSFFVCVYEYDIDPVFCNELDLFMELAAPRLKQLVMYNVYYQKPLACYPFEQLETLIALKSKPIQFDKSYVLAPRTVKTMIVSNRQHLFLPSFLTAESDPAHSVQDVVNLQAFHCDWDWSLGQFVNIDNLVILCHAAAPPVLRHRQFEFPNSLVWSNKASLRHLTLHFPDFGVNQLKMDVLSLASLTNLQHLDLSFPNDMYKHYVWITWFNSIMSQLDHAITLTIHLHDDNSVASMFKHAEPTRMVHSIRIISRKDSDTYHARICYVDAIALLKAFPCVTQVYVKHCVLVSLISNPASSNVLHAHAAAVHTLHIQLPGSLDDFNYKSLLDEWSQAFPHVKTLILDWDSDVNTPKDSPLCFLLHVTCRFKQLERLVVAGLDTMSGIINNLPPMELQDFSNHPLKYLHIHGNITQSAQYFLAVCFPHVPVVALYPRKHGTHDQDSLSKKLSCHTNDWIRDDVAVYVDGGRILVSSIYHEDVLSSLVRMEQSAIKCGYWMNDADMHKLRNTILARIDVKDRFLWIYQYTVVKQLRTMHLDHLLCEHE